MRLIDADLLLNTGSGIKMIIPKNCHPYEAIKIQGKAFEDAVKNAPTVDAKPVVRCKDCKYWEKCYSSLLGEVMCCTGQGSMRIQKLAEDFCSSGERRDGE